VSARLVLVSDSHLSRRSPEAQRNWDAVVRDIEAAQPDLVVHVGDLSLDGAHDSVDLRDARHFLARIPAPWLAVPGNHDIGDNPSTESDPADHVTIERLARWLELVGPDHWSLELGGWQLVGIDAQLFGSGLSTEAEQWEWIGAELEGVPSDRPHILVTHKPLAAEPAELAAAPPYRFIPSPARERVSDLLPRASTRLVVSGHVHQYRCLVLDELIHLWAPTTWAVLPDSSQTVLGTKRCGVIHLELNDEGRIDHALVEPDGMAQLTLNENVASPYDH
jgi:3',5'-cyclic AMP phosphodiesterase CpdA